MIIINNSPNYEVTWIYKRNIKACPIIAAYSTLVDDIRTSHIDNMKILKHLIYAKENQLLLFDGSKDTGVC